MRPRVCRAVGWEVDAGPAVARRRAHSSGRSAGARCVRGTDRNRYGRVVAVCRISRQDFITVSRRRPVDSLCMSVMAGSPRWTYLLLPDMPHWPRTGLGGVCHRQRFGAHGSVRTAPHTRCRPPRIPIWATKLARLWLSGRSIPYWRLRRVSNRIRDQRYDRHANARYGLYARKQRYGRAGYCLRGRDGPVCRRGSFSRPRNRPFDGKGPWASALRSDRRHRFRAYTPAPFRNRRGNLHSSVGCTADCAAPLHGEPHCCVDNARTQQCVRLCWPKGFWFGLGRPHRWTGCSRLSRPSPASASPLAEFERQLIAERTPLRPIFLDLPFQTIPRELPCPVVRRAFQTPWTAALSNRTVW